MESYGRSKRTVWYAGGAAGALVTVRATPPDCVVNQMLTFDGQFTPTLRSSDGHTMSFRNGSIAAMEERVNLVSRSA